MEMSVRDFFEELIKINDEMYEEMFKTREKDSDKVHRPGHYQKENGWDLFEVWNKLYSMNEFISIMESHADKYIKRHRYKNGIEDLEKAIETLTRLKEFEERYLEEQ